MDPSAEGARGKSDHARLKIENNLDHRLELVIVTNGMKHSHSTVVALLRSDQGMR